MSVRPDFANLAGQRSFWLPQIGGIERAQIARHTLFNPRPAPFDLAHKNQSNEHRNTQFLRIELMHSPRAASFVTMIAPFIRKTGAKSLVTLASV